MKKRNRTDNLLVQPSRGDPCESSSVARRPAAHRLDYSPHVGFRAARGRMSGHAALPLHRPTSHIRVFTKLRDRKLVVQLEVDGAGLSTRPAAEALGKRLVARAVPHAMFNEKRRELHTSAHKFLTRSKSERRKLLKNKGVMVGAGRFERPTPCAQGRCATRLRYAPTFADFFILDHFQNPAKLPSLFLRPNCAKTVQEPLQFGLTVPKLLPSSWARRFSFNRASRFICNFICEYFLKTWASPCRSS